MIADRWNRPDGGRVVPGMKSLRSAPVLGLAIAALLLAGCADASRPTNGPGGPAYDPAGSPTSTAPTLPSTGASGGPSASLPAGVTRTLVGTVDEGAEPSCLILQSSQGRFELLSPDPVPRVGDHVTVTGHVVKAMSHCMAGQPFLVESLTVG